MQVGFGARDVAGRFGSGVSFWIWIRNFFLFFSFFYFFIFDFRIFDFSILGVWGSGGWGWGGGKGEGSLSDLNGVDYSTCASHFPPPHQS